MNIFLIIVFILAILILCFFVGMLCYHTFGLFKKLYHDILKWHEPSKVIEQWSDGCSQHSICKYCGKEIMQDSQGNWF